MKKIKSLIIVIMAIFTFVSCREDEPAEKSEGMLWEISTSSEENIKTVFNLDLNIPIQIVIDGEGGEATLKCSNYKNIVINGDINGNGEYENDVCQYSAKVTEPGVITISFNKITNRRKDEHLISILLIDGIDGKNTGMTIAEIHRIL